MVSMKEAINAMESAFVELSRGNVIAPNRMRWIFLIKMLIAHYAGISLESILLRKHGIHKLF